MGIKAFSVEMMNQIEREFSWQYDAISKVVENAIKRDALYPYAIDVYNFLKRATSSKANAEKLKISLKEHEEDAQFDDFREAFFRVLGLFDEYISNAERWVNSFRGMKERVSNHIQLEVRPDESLGMGVVYFTQGRLIIPTRKVPLGYGVFDISTDGLSNIRFRRLSEDEFDSLDKAVEKYANNILGTIAIAKNTEHYPLEETALPIIKEKYEQAQGL